MVPSGRCDRIAAPPVFDHTSQYPESAPASSFMPSRPAQMEPSARNPTARTLSVRALQHADTKVHGAPPGAGFGSGTAVGRFGFGSFGPTVGSVGFGRAGGSGRGSIFAPSLP